ncbi:putative bifunctional diguanylate cyclase/phosphodiesterase [Acinetobacter higginsii]|uniref:putative bifunctional diguanylate cyclase/phosphodiesterase n=1 Tax=Acinetobacter higginsii TaxID=70347 RepID=UPI001F4B006F|nr:EAL domain-containing protein [Acinetobacter higginsii]MCH7296797.1 EAL domain-containing protein [Acinetobacter higginsii]MCH7306030.1 EAL domain-containing protein [Acinetobacter higginsii]MDO3666410.1 EAL domain-containing protein [Acinetobacter higginsii]
MVHVDYDSTLVIVSILVAVATCYAAVSMEELVFKGAYKKFEKSILVASGLILGLAIWSMHFVGMLASHLPEGYHFDVNLTVLSYLIGAAASIFAVWLTSRPTLPIPRLILGAVFMGLGISGMHYTGMAALSIENHAMHYDPLLVLCSVLIAISGSGLSFFFIFKYKTAVTYRTLLKAVVAILMALSIVGMHYTGMAATYFDESLAQILTSEQTEQSVLLFTIIFITSLVLVAGFAVAVLEARLEERNEQLTLINKELATQSLHDALTKLPNRLYLTEHAEVVFNHHRLNGQKAAFLYIDLDRFKSVNDAFGHHIGDQLLIQMANRLYTKLGDNHKLFRIGGDEFVLISEDTDFNEAMQLSEDILHCIQETYLIAAKDINISASVGIAMYPEHGTNVQDLLINADVAMLISKDQGRNTYTMFHTMSDQQDVRSQSKLINDLYKAVDEQQFVLFYQPKFTCNYEVCGVEALIRWKHPTLGLLTPQMFIEGAEKTGLIIPMGYWALEQACQQIQKWERSNSPFYPIAVNLSALQFENKKLFSVLEQLLEQYQIQPHHLILEITESTAMHHIDSSIRTLERLRKLGIRIAIDDFGTGYSSFLYLKDLPVDELKIDRGFLIDLKPNSKEEAILESIIHLAAKLGLIVTAEGVETQQQADILTSLGCNQLQGYLLGTPVNVEGLVLHRYQHFA